MFWHEPFFYGDNEMNPAKRMTVLIALSSLLTGCSVGVGGFGIGGGSNGVGVGAGLSFPIGGSASTKDNATDSQQPDCNGEVYQVQPIYPAQAAAQEFEGKVAVKFDVKPNGRATNYSAKGDRAFFAETWKAVSRSCWSPGVSRDFEVEFTLHKPVTLALVAP